MPSTVARFCATAPYNLSAASANSLTPSFTSSAVIASSEMPDLLEFGEHPPCILDVFLEAVAWRAMIAEGVECRRRYGIDGVGTDQFLYIEYVAVLLVLGAGGRPQQTLSLGALGLQLLPACARRTAACTPDRRAWRWRSRPCPLARPARAFSAGSLACAIFSSSCLSTALSMRLTKKLATLATCEGSPPCRDVLFEAREIGFGDLLIDLLREQQRDVDADAFADQMLDRGQAFRRRRHLDHQIRRD